MVDLQEYINGLKSFRRYCNEKNKALAEYNVIEEKLKNMNEYVSPSAVTTVEITKFKNGKIIKEKVAAPKSSPDPMRKERIRSNLVSRQCELIDRQKYYQNKIDEIIRITNNLPANLKQMVWDVYVKKNAKDYAIKFKVTESRVYGIVKERLAAYFEISTNSKNKNFVEKP